MRVANNVVALNVTNNMAKTNRRVSLAMGRLSSGLKINRAKDDSAGYAISTRLDMQVQGYTRGSENALDAVSLTQTADGALESMHELLQRCRELSVQAASDTNTTEDRRMMQKEIEQYVDEINKISSEKSSFNGIDFLNGQAERVCLNEDSDRSKITFVSDNLNPGDLTYTVNSLGTSTEYACGYDGTQTVSKDGIIYVNGSQISISAGESADEIYQKVQLACKDSNISFDSSTGTFKADELGSKYDITMSGDEQLLAELELSGGTVTQGQDCDVTFDSYIRTSDGQSDNTFNPAITTDGNKITMIGQDNKTIIVELSETNPIDGTNYTAPYTATDEITDSGQLMLQLGGKSSSVMGMYIPTVNAQTLEIDTANVSTRLGAEAAIQIFDDAIQEVSTVRSNIGAYENRLTYTSDSLLVASDATTVALSRIRDTDMAVEMANYSKDSVIYQAGTSILAQANQRPQIILQLIQ